MPQIIYTRQIARSIRDGDIDKYQKLRYPNIPDGELVIFTNVDFTSVNFAKLSAGFFQFDNCILDKVSGLHGQPIRINSCSARQIDLRGVRAIIHARDSDLTGVHIDKDTTLVYDSGKFGAVSTFINCTINPETIDELTRQGVIFKQE